MQEQINEKTVAISIKTAKLTAEVLQKAIRKLLDAKKHKAPKIYKGKQTLKHLMKQNTVRPMMRTGHRRKYGGKRTPRWGIPLTSRKCGMRI